MFVLLACFDTYFALPLNVSSSCAVWPSGHSSSGFIWLWFMMPSRFSQRFYRYHELLHEKEAKKNKKIGTSTGTRPPYFYIFRKAFPQLFNVFFVFFVTLSMFPSVQSGKWSGTAASMERLQYSNSHVSIPQTSKYRIRNISSSPTRNCTWMCCVSSHSISPQCLAVWWHPGFNGYGYLSLIPFFSIPNQIASIFQPKKEYLFLPVILRILLIPLFLVCNYQPLNIERILPIYIKNDWIYWAIGTLLGFSSGYLRYDRPISLVSWAVVHLFLVHFSSLGMMYAPQTVEPQYAQTAGMFAAAMLITGIFTGISSSVVYPTIVSNISW